MTARTLFAAAIVLAGPFAATAAAETPQQKAHRLLNTTARVKSNLGFLHFGADYVSHKYNKTGGVRTATGTTLPGHFYLEYEYTWKAGGEYGSTTLSFYFDDKGGLTNILIDRTTAAFNQPYFLAGLSIKILGEAVYDALKNKLSEADRRFVRRLIDTADAKGMHLFFLRLDLASAR